MNHINIISTASSIFMIIIMTLLVCEASILQSCSFAFGIRDSSVFCTGYGGKVSDQATLPLQAMLRTLPVSK